MPMFGCITANNLARFGDVKFWSARRQNLTYIYLLLWTLFYVPGHHSPMSGVLTQQNLPQDCFLAANFSAFLYLPPKLKFFPCKCGLESIDFFILFHLVTMVFTDNTYFSLFLTNSTCLLYRNNESWGHKTQYSEVCQMLFWWLKNLDHSINIWDTVTKVSPLRSLY